MYGLRMGLERLTQLGGAAHHIRLTGGGAASAVWRQVVADVFNLPVSVQVVDEGAALGAALQALWMHQHSGHPGMPLAALLDEHLETDPARGCEPGAEAVEAYHQAFAEYQRHVQALTPLYAA